MCWGFGSDSGITTIDIGLVMATFKVSMEEAVPLSPEIYRIMQEVASKVLETC